MENCANASIALRNAGTSGVKTVDLQLLRHTLQQIVDHRLMRIDCRRYDIVVA